MTALVRIEDEDFVELPNGFVEVNYFQWYNEKVLKRAGRNPDDWWKGALDLINGDTPEVMENLWDLDERQRKTDAWYKANGPWPPEPKNLYYLRERERLFSLLEEWQKANGGAPSVVMGQARDGYIAKLTDFLDKEIKNKVGHSEETTSGAYEKLRALLVGKPDVFDDLAHLKFHIDTRFYRINGWAPPHNDSGEYKKFQDHEAYFNRHKAFLYKIGDLEPEGPDFKIETKGVPHAIAKVDGPQMVVPLRKKRMAIKAVSSRYGSLYGALYESDVVPETWKTAKKLPFIGYNRWRGEQVVDYSKTQFLDKVFDLKEGTHKGVQNYLVEKGRDGKHALTIVMADGSKTTLADPNKFVGHKIYKDGTLGLWFKNNGLHVEIKINRKGNVGARDLAGIQDIQLESAITVILDGEDSIMLVNAKDRIELQENLVGILDGTLTAEMVENGKPHTRRLAPDKDFIGVDGKKVVVPGRAEILLRNVGAQLFSRVVRDKNKNPVPEGFLDIVTNAQIFKNHIGDDPDKKVPFVQPKLQGPKFARLWAKFIDKTEPFVHFFTNTILVGFMDEERRGSLNLKECIRAFAKRIFFINTGFLDRIGNELYTAMEAGVLMSQSAIRASSFLKAYENSNVFTGLLCGLAGIAQIGKGMYDAPKLMLKMLIDKIMHPKAGADTAWVPGPVAAILHAIHYHLVNVPEVQANLTEKLKVISREDLRDRMIRPPVASNDNDAPGGDTKEARRIRDANAQNLLGYLVRGVELDIGCSTVDDIDDIGRMQDRATCRISRNSSVNRLRHGLDTKSQMIDSLERMAVMVDRQNIGGAALAVWRLAHTEIAGKKLGERAIAKQVLQFLWDKTSRDVNYKPMSGNPEDETMQAARCLIFKDEAERLVFNNEKEMYPDRFSETAANDYVEMIFNHFRRKAIKRYGGPIPPQQLVA